MNRFLLQMAGEAGAGKSTLARAIGKNKGAIVIDKDDITAPLIDQGVFKPGKGGAGYSVFFQLADSFLEQGLGLCSTALRLGSVSLIEARFSRPGMKWTTESSNAAVRMWLSKSGVFRRPEGKPGSHDPDLSWMCHCRGRASCWT